MCAHITGEAIKEANDRRAKVAETLSDRKAARRSEKEALAKVALGMGWGCGVLLAGVRATAGSKAALGLPRCGSLQSCCQCCSCLAS